MRLILGVFFIFASLLNFSVIASMNYKELPSSGFVVPSGKIEAVELFSYGCVHCFHLEPSVNKWAASLPDDVVFKRVPAMFGGQWDVLGQLFLTLEAMGVPPQVHQEVFTAVQNRHPLNTPQQMADFLETVGVEREKFIATLHSFTVAGKVMEARNRTKSYKLSGVPAMVVDNKYLFDLGVGGPEEMFDLANKLIDKERQPR